MNSKKGKLTISTLAMPADTNPSGDIFGGYLMSQMDLAAGIRSGERAGGRVVTVAVEGMVFHRPVKVGDVLSVYTDIIGVGNTSIDIHVEAWVKRNHSQEEEMVTEANFKFVALDPEGRPKRVTQ